MRLAYFINQYPKVSHSFIRREILALERQGATVVRMALRGWDDSVVDAEDQAEQGKTHYVLRGGLRGLLGAVLGQLLRNPVRLGRAWLQASRMARMSDRPLLYHWIYLAEACKLLALLRGSGVEHVHAHFGTNSAEVVMLAHALGGPGFSFTVHGPEEFDKPQGLHLREKIEHARFVVAISSFGRSQLYRWVGYAHWPKVNVVRCGLDKAFHQVVHVPVPAVPRLVCVGRLCEQKGQMLLLGAVRQLRDAGVFVELVLAGDGEMRPEVERLIALHGLQAQVRITGWISAEQVRQELLAARALVLPSFAEGLPVVIMEAMALRRPVLSTFVAGIPELVQQGEHGWLVPAGDVDALAQAMQDCVRASTAELDDMGAKAYQKVLQRHDVDTEAGHLLQLFRQAAKGGGLC